MAWPWYILTVPLLFEPIHKCIFSLFLLEYQNQNQWIISKFRMQPYLFHARCTVFLLSGSDIPNKHNQKKTDKNRWHSLNLACALRVFRLTCFIIVFTAFQKHLPCGCRTKYRNDSNVHRRISIAKVTVSNKIECSNYI